MLDKENIIKILKDMKLPLKDYFITSGAALVIHGVKEFTSNIDLACTKSLAEYFLNKGCKYKVGENNLRIIKVSDTIELIENWFAYKTEFVEGLPVATVESIKKQKLELGRKKDIEDVRLISEYIINKK